MRRWLHRETTFMPFALLTGDDGSTGNTEGGLQGEG